MSKTKPIKNSKFRIFVDGSYDDKVNIGTVAYHMQNIVNFENRVINVCVHNKTFAQKVDCKHSVDAELKAIKLGFDTFNKMVKVYPILNKLPARVKSDNVPIIKYITKGKWKDDVDFDNSLLDDLNLLKEETQQQEILFKLSCYILACKQSFGIVLHTFYIYTI